jgi:hypothetical protein
MEKTANSTKKATFNEKSPNPTKNKIMLKKIIIK